MNQQASKSELRQKLDALSDARADIEAAPFYEKEKKINKFISDLEVFLDLIVGKIDHHSERLNVVEASIFSLASDKNKGVNNG